MVDLAGISLSCSPLGDPSGSDVSANAATTLESAKVPDASVKIVDAERKEKPRSSPSRKAQLQQANSNTPKGVPQGREGASGQSDLDSQPHVNSSGENSSHSAGTMNTTGDGAAEGAGAGQGEGRQGGPGAGQGSGGSGVLSLGDVDQKPRLVKHVEPEYPEHARKKALSGKVMARFRVDESGIVHDPTVASSSPPGIFDQCVLEAVKRWHFEPARHKGKAVPVLVTVPVRFDISGK
jgi:protein TonB